MQTETENIKAAKKMHACSWCGETIEIGQPYARWRWYDSGDAVTVKAHPECRLAWDELASEEGGSVEVYPGENPRGGIAD